MKIVLLAHNLPAAGGLSVAKNIIYSTLALLPEHEFLITIPANKGYRDFSSMKNVTALEMPCGSLIKRFFWEKGIMRPAIKQFAPEWLWALGNTGLINPPCRQSVLIHDPHLVYPESIYRKYEKIPYIVKVRILKFLVRRMLKNTNRIYCQTAAMLKRFSEIFSYPPGKIGSCPNAVSALIVKKSSSKMPEKLIPHKEKFKLFVLSRFYGHKNFAGIVDMFMEYREELKDVICVWTISKEQHSQAQALLRKIKDNGLENLIINVGPVPQDELETYYDSCDALFLPTLLESFSGTYLEAIQFSCPIITSDRDFAREVCGEAALYCDPLSTESMKNAVLKLKADAVCRQGLIENGKLRLKTYIRDWNNIVKDVLEQENISF